MLAVINRRAARVAYSSGELEFLNPVIVRRSNVAIQGSLSVAQLSFIEGNPVDERSPIGNGQGSRKGTGKS